MSLNANARRDPGAAVISLDEMIATEYSGGAANGQASFSNARVRLLEAVRRKPEPQPVVDLFDERRWQRDSRRLQAQRILRSIWSTTNVATALNVTPQSVNNWRAGRCAPTPAHWRQLRALHVLVTSAQTHSKDSGSRGFVRRFGSR